VLGLSKRFVCNVRFQSFGGNPNSSRGSAIRPLTAGGGGAAVTLASYVLPKLEKGEWKRVLFVPTGALMSTVSFNEGASVPGIAHGIVLESDA